MPVKTEKRHKINFGITPEGNLLIYRNGKKELSFTPASPELIQELEKVLRVDRDYESFLEFYDERTHLHLSNWLFDYMQRVEPEVFELLKIPFKRAHFNHE